MGCRGGGAYNETLKAWSAENQKLKLEGKPAIPQPTPVQPRPAMRCLPMARPTIPRCCLMA